MKVLLMSIFLSFFSFTYVEKLTHESLYNEILEQNLEFPDVVFAQAIIESGNFKSDICRNNYNLFGMRKPKSRKTTAVGVRRGYAVYEDYGFSVSDYGLYQDRVLSKKKYTKSQYISYLGKKYARNPKYVSEIKKTMVKYKYIFYDTSKVRYDGIIDN